MSTYRTNYTTINNILPHPNPEVHSLQIAKCYDFDVIIKKDSFVIGDNVFYVQIDSILPTDLENLLFPPGSKIKLTKSRVKQIRIQRYASQGMILRKEDVLTILKQRGLNTNLEFELEKDYSELLGLKKYEPENDPSTKVNTSTKKTRVDLNPLFHQYNGLEHLKYFPNALDNLEVVIEEKLHGSLARLSYLSTNIPEFTYNPNRYFKENITYFIEIAIRRFKRLLGILPAYSYSWGSNTVDRTFKRDGGFYEKDIWLQAIEDAKLFDKIQKDTILYGEVVFEGCQKNYSYGHKTPHFVLYDIKQFYINELGEYVWKWLSPEEVESFAKQNEIDFVPILYKGIYNLQLAKELALGKSIYYPQHVKEGVVVKCINPTLEGLPNKKAMFKCINPEYLDKDQSDFR